ncbi:Upstream activation factor subunit spp27 [Morus notabilis]|uniref:Upstream activation factor subunit spp27 n=1 Tax=Morus notabilis TaxID=981085 RepID=W9RJM4_9ROSA|nr:SWI/SNF and RSC complexes subunit ssr3 [Morus notabilis]EXB76660.1 Upstream activation factor subunit spp27 [Morus notabilis]
MALSSGLISSTSSFLSAETPSFPSVPFPAARPFYLRVSRTPTLATASKQASSTSKGELRGIMKPRRVSPEMQALVGAPEISRTQALKLIWAHIKENNLQDPENKRIIICDEKLKKIFKGRDRVGFLEVAGLITPHFL